MVLWRRKGAAVQGTAPGFHHFFLVSSDGPNMRRRGEPGEEATVTPDFTGKTECISRMRQDHFTHT
jgi:hypothetical protein